MSELHFCLLMSAVYLAPRMSEGWGNALGLVWLVFAFVGIFKK